MGYFCWLHVKSSNHLHTELNLGYLKGTKFCLESKASFIDISSIASFKPFLIAWLWEYCTFSDSSVVNLRCSPWPKYTQLGTIFQKNNRVLLSNFFSSSNMFFIRLYLANTWKKIGGHRARLREKDNFSVIELSLREISYVLRMHELVCVLMTRKSCAVGMRNAILRNYLKRLQMENSFFGQKETGAERVAMATALRASFCFFCDGQL